MGKEILNRFFKPRNQGYKGFNWQGFFGSDIAKKKGTFDVEDSIFIFMAMEGTCGTKSAPKIIAWNHKGKNENH
jgi:hypothetical protein